MSKIIIIIIIIVVIIIINFHFSIFLIAKGSIFLIAKLHKTEEGKRERKPKPMFITYIDIKNSSKYNSR
jgi:flagellar basal body-associated protein FliL